MVGRNETSLRALTAPLGDAITDMSIRLSTALIVVLLWAGVAGSEDRPPSIYVDVGACPFECCTYRRWTVTKATKIWDTPRGKRVVGFLREGDSVEGLTGEVISKPLAIKADRDIPKSEIKAGETFYVLHYEGEGNWMVWSRGEITSVYYSEMHMPQPPTADWWVKVKAADGNVGWTLSNRFVGGAASDRHFAHQDACE